MAEISLTSILRKTEAGLVAIKQNDRSFPMKARSLLIMVDGVKTLQDLSRFSPDPNSAIDSANVLINAGFVDLVMTTPTLSQSAKPLAQITAQPQSSQGTAPVDLKTSIRKVTRALQDMMGPSADNLCMQVEKCKNIQELTAKIYQLEPVVASMRSAQKAKEFVAAVLPN